MATGEPKDEIRVPGGWETVLCGGQDMRLALTQRLNIYEFELCPIIVSSAAHFLDRWFTCKISMFQVSAIKQ